MLPNTLKRFEVEFDENWRERIKEIPRLSFPHNWEIKIIPPFGGAMARFIVIVKDQTDSEKSVSVYLDMDSALGYYGDKPYWEIYPICVYEGLDEKLFGDVERFAMDDTDGLIKGIAKAIDLFPNTDEEKEDANAS